MPLNHAKHNQEVCNHLYSHTKFNDWIVTTAYYSAIYYVRYKIFPLEIKANDTKRRFKTFSDYCASYHYSENKHEIIENLVQEYLPNLYKDFKLLKDNCWTARYDDYNILDEIVYMCVKSLNIISKKCSTDDNNIRPFND